MVSEVVFLKGFFVLRVDRHIKNTPTRLKSYNVA